MRVLVTGAFGNLGKPVMEQLIREGHRVRAFDLDTRANRRAARRFGRDLEVVWGTLTDEADVARAVEGQEAVIHLAFVLPYLSATGVSSEAEPRWARNVNVGGTRRLLNARARPHPVHILAARLWPHAGQGAIPKGGRSAGAHGPLFAPQDHL